MIFRSICFQVVKTEPFKQFFCSYFKVIHEFLKYRSTFVSSGITSKICKARTIVLIKQIINKSILKSVYRSLRHTICNVLRDIEQRTYFRFLWPIAKVTIGFSAFRSNPKTFSLKMRRLWKIQSKVFNKFVRIATQNYLLSWGVFE